MSPFPTLIITVFNFRRPAGTSGKSGLARLPGNFLRLERFSHTLFIIHLPLKPIFTVRLLG